MDLLDALASPPPKKNSFGDWIASQDQKRQKALAAAAVDSRWTNYALMTLLRDHGASCSKDSVKKWRNSLGYTGD